MPLSLLKQDNAAKAAFFLRDFDDDEQPVVADTQLSHSDPKQPFRFLDTHFMSSNQLMLKSFGYKINKNTHFRRHVFATGPQNPKRGRLCHMVIENGF
jgi:hypothetical protein